MEVRTDQQLRSRLRVGQKYVMTQERVLDQGNPDLVRGGRRQLRQGGIRFKRDHGPYPIVRQCGILHGRRDQLRMDANPFEKAAEKRVQYGGRAGKAGNGMVSHAEASFAWKGYFGVESAG